MEQTNNLVKLETHSAFNGLKLSNKDDYDRAMTLLTALSKSKKSGFTTPEEGLNILVKANDLGVNLSCALENIHNINGKPTLSASLMNALLTKAGVIINKVADYIPRYEYTDGCNVYVDYPLPPYLKRCRNAEEALAKSTDDVIGIYPLPYYKDMQGRIFNELIVKQNNYVIAPHYLACEKLAKNNQYSVYKTNQIAIDYITEYEFIRNINGKERKVIGRFTRNDAITAGLFEKEVWQKYPNRMTEKRAFSNGAREIGSDILLGMYETTEICLEEGADIPSSAMEDVDCEVITE